MSGRPKQQVFVYEKKQRGKLIDTLSSIEEFKNKYLPHYKEESKFPGFYQKGYVDLQDVIATTKRGQRELFRQYTIDENEFTTITRKLKRNYKVEVYNLKNEILAKFENIRIAEKLTGVSCQDIERQFKAKKNTVNERGLIFKKII